LKKILLFSAGIDSVCTLANIYDDADYFVYVHMGLPYQVTELKKAEKILLHFSEKFKLNLIDKFFPIYHDLYDFLEDADKVFIPYRNLLLILTALKYFHNDDLSILIGNTIDDRVHDNSKIFIDQSNKFFKATYDKRVSVGSLFSNYSKISMVRETIKTTKIDENDVEKLTFSCFNPIQNKECLSCNACFRKNVILYELGIFRPFYNSEILQYYAGNLNELSYDRKKTTKKYLERLSLKSLTRSI